MTDQLSLEKLEQAYDSPPWWYDVRGFFILCFSYRSSLWAQVRFFSANMGPRHLEAAIGTATLFSIIRRWRALRGLARTHTVGFDYAEPMLAGARRRLGEAPDVTLLRADVARLDFPDATFDSANIANAVHCFPDVGAGLVELSRVLKPGGRLAVNALLVPSGAAPLKWLSNRINAWGMRKGILHDVFTEAQVHEHMTTAGFAIVASERTGNTLNVIGEKPKAEQP